MTLSQAFAQSRADKAILQTKEKRMLPKEGDKKFSISSKFDVIYKDFKLITETASYQVFEALNRRNPQEKHSIRVLDPTKDLVKSKFDSAATLFKQELLYLHIRCPGSVLFNTLEISKPRKQIACAVRQYSLAASQLQEIEGSMDLKNPKVIEKLLNDVISDVEFLWRDLKMKNIASIIKPENIYYLKEKRIFFLGSWDKITEENTARPQDLTATVIDSVTPELRSQDIAAEIKALALALLKIKKVDVKELEFLLSLEEADISTYNAAVKSTVEQYFNDSQKLKNLITRMLSLDPKNLPNLEEFKIKEDKIQVQFERTKNEANTVRKEVGIRVPLEESKINLPSNPVILIDSPLTSTPPTLLAWCSYTSNNISVMDLVTKQNYATFEGARISETGWRSWAHVKEIPNSKLLVSLHHNYEKFANMEIFDISKKGKANKIYSLGEVSGIVGDGDVTYNSRRSILGAIPVTGRIAYHLFTIDSNASTAGGIVKLNRKSKWHSQYSTQTGNYITGFDFNPAGDSIATVDNYGVCLISDVNTNNYVFHLQVGKRDWSGRCRWSTNTGGSLLYVKYDYKKLNILDVEKKALILSNSVELEKKGWTRWIDVCQSNANLLASGGDERNLKIFDKRESKIVKTFEGLNSDFITCVRWNPSGDMIAVASFDKTAKLCEFKTGKVLHTGTTSDGSLSASSDKIWVEKKTEEENSIKTTK